MTSRFLGHLPCPKCGSKDNLGDYDDHQFCFGCGYRLIKGDVKSLRARLNYRSNSQEIAEEIQDISVVKDIPPPAMRWLYSYGISRSEIDLYIPGYNLDRDLLILYKDTNYWQARSFQGHKTKYLSMGIKPLIKYGDSNKVVLVEDILSALKLGRVLCGRPLLGTSIPKLLVPILKGYSTVYVWLDRDKATLAIQHKRYLQELGINAKVIISPKDPKEYTTEELKEWLKEN